MVSTPSSLLQLQLQGTGDNSGTWGTIANQLFSRMEEAIAQIASVTVTTTDVTLDDTQYVEYDAGTGTAEAHCAAIKASGTLTGDRNIIIPSRDKIYLVWNNTGGSFDLTIKTSGGTGAVVPQGTIAWVVCDGTDTYAVGEITTNLFTATYNDQGNKASGTLTLDFSDNQVDGVTATGNFTVAFSNIAATGTSNWKYLKIFDGGSYTITWPSSVVWDGGVAPTLATGSTSYTGIVFNCDDGGTYVTGKVAVTSATEA